MCGTSPVSLSNFTSAQFWKAILLQLVWCNKNNLHNFMAHHQTFLDTNLWESFGSPTLHKFTYMKKAGGHPSLLGGNNIFRPAQKISLFTSTLMIELLLCFYFVGQIAQFLCFQRSVWTWVSFSISSLVWHQSDRHR